MWLVKKICRFSRAFPECVSFSFRTLSRIFGIMPPLIILLMYSTNLIQFPLSLPILFTFCLSNLQVLKIHQCPSVCVVASTWNTKPEETIWAATIGQRYPPRTTVTALKPAFLYVNIWGKLLNIFLPLLQFFIIHKQETTFMCYFFLLCGWLPLCILHSWREQFFKSSPEFS